MTLKECIELYKKEPDRYKGFTTPNDVQYYTYNDKNNVFVAYYKNNSSLHYNITGFGHSYIISEDWEMIEDIISSIPNGFIKNPFGDYVKINDIELWIVIYWDSTFNKEFVWGAYTDECIADRTKIYLNKLKDSRWKYIKTLHLSQQYSIKLEDIK